MRVITSIAIILAIALLSGCSAAPSRPTPPQIDPSEFDGMSPAAYEAMVEYNRATWAYVRDLEG